MSDPVAVLRLEPDDLDGHTIDELTDYLDAGLQPADPSIDDSPACRIALAALQRLKDLAVEYLDDARPDATTGSDWIDSVLAAIPVDARAGRRFPLPGDDPHVVATVTEGAIRGLVRAIGDEVPGLLVGAVRIGSGEPTPLSIDVALVYGTVLQEAVESFRRALRLVLPDHAPFELGPIDVDVIGLIPADPKEGPR
jgi:hypothetical protein